jgi:hypothetical protein
MRNPAGALSVPSQPTIDALPSGASSDGHAT